MPNSTKTMGFAPSTAETTATGKLQQCILSIEDNEEAMFLVKSAIEEFGDGKYRLEWANCLKDGVNRLSKGGVDLVLLDLGLPDSSGSLTYDSVRTNAPEVPVLVLTGDGTEETESTVIDRGGEDYLVKDQVSGALLVQAIQSTIYASKLQRRVPLDNSKTARVGSRG